MLAVVLETSWRAHRGSDQISFGRIGYLIQKEPPWSGGECDRGFRQKSVIHS